MAVPPVAIRSSMRSPLVLPDRIGVDLHLVDAVFERIGDPHGFMRELALFADRDEPGRELVGHRSPENESASLDPATLATRPPANGFTSSSTARRKARASPKRVVMSRNTIPGFGLSGIERIADFRSVSKRWSMLLP